jgi:predicted aldo/keto reductase-like oxidoreductase
MRWRLRRGYGKLIGTKEQLDRENANGNASMCADYGKCLEKRPQQIDIPVELEKVHAISDHQ